MALAANTRLQRKNTHVRTIEEYLVKTAAVIYQDSLVCVNVAGTLISSFATGTSNKFVGIAAVALGGATFPVTGSATAPVRVRVENDIEVLLPTVTSITVGHTGNTAIYATDDERACLVTTLGPRIGIITKFVATNSAWVRLRGAVGANATL